MVSFEVLSIDNYKQVALIDACCFGKEAWSENLYYQEILDASKIYVVARERDEIIGFGGFAQVLDEGHIMNIGILPSYRHQGVGSSILDEMIRIGKTLGIMSFTLEVRVSNLNAISLYQKKGFILAGIRKRYYANSEDACIYWLYL